ncbi:hypothetical protein FF38_07948 [Lucilia cuprina]|uniref:Uncharacterized protein n=1 Tax=Lucilia cuprina TaxID=7375 RepID=A0A0L0BSM0_LUCCU|nr:hypothetical protein FF38_07948 [Lucilia cuprina]
MAKRNFLRCIGWAKPRPASSSMSFNSNKTLPLLTFSEQRVLYCGIPSATSSQAKTCEARHLSIENICSEKLHSVAPSAERALFLFLDRAKTLDILPQVPPRPLRAPKAAPLDLGANFLATAPGPSESTGEPKTNDILSGSTVMQGPLSDIPSLKLMSPPVLSRSLLFLNTESFEHELRSPAVLPELLLKADREFELPRPLSSLR